MKNDDDTIYPVVPNSNHFKHMIISESGQNSDYIYPVVPQPNSLNRNIKNSKYGNCFKSRKQLAFIVIGIIAIILLIIAIILLAVLIPKANSEKTTLPASRPFLTFLSSPSVKPSYTTTSYNYQTYSNFVCNFIAKMNKSSSQCSYGYIGEYCDECSLQFQKPNMKVIENIEAIPNSWPFMAFVYFKYSLNQTSYNLTYYCSGILIDRKNILIPAHCLDQISSYSNLTYQSIKVYLGLNNINQVLNSSKITEGIEYLINDYFIHPNYSNQSLLNDIAILRLNNSTILDCNIQPVCLPDPSLNYTNNPSDQAIYIGYGSSSNNSISTFTNNLYNIKLDLLNNSFCLNTESNKIKDWSQQLCAGTLNQTVCTNNYGGPLVIKNYVNGIQKYIAVGILSYYNDCEKPGVFLKINNYLDWISSILSNTTSY